MYIDCVVRGIEFEKLIASYAERAVHGSFELNRVIPSSDLQGLPRRTSFPLEFAQSDLVVFRASVSAVELVSLPRNRTLVAIKVPAIVVAESRVESIERSRVGVRVMLRFELARARDIGAIRSTPLPELRSILVSVLYEMTLEAPNGAQVASVLTFTPTTTGEGDGAAIVLEVATEVGAGDGARAEWLRANDVFPELESTWNQLAASFPVLPALDTSGASNLLAISNNENARNAFLLMNEGMTLQEQDLYFRFQIESRFRYNIPGSLGGWFSNPSRSERVAWGQDVLREWASFYADTNRRELFGTLRVAPRSDIIGRYPAEMLVEIVKMSVFLALTTFDSQVRDTSRPSPFGTQFSRPRGIFNPRGAASWDAATQTVSVQADIVVLGLCGEGQRDVRATVRVTARLATVDVELGPRALRVDMRLNVAVNREDMLGCARDEGIFESAAAFIDDALFGGSVVLDPAERRAGRSVPFANMLRQVVAGRANILVKPDETDSSRVILFLTLPALTLFPGSETTSFEPFLASSFSSQYRAFQEDDLYVMADMQTRSRQLPRERLGFLLSVPRTFQWMTSACQFRPSWLLQVTNDGGVPLRVDWPRWVDGSSTWANDRPVNVPQPGGGSVSVAVPVRWTFRIGARVVGSGPFLVPPGTTLDMILEVDPTYFLWLVWPTATGAARSLPTLDVMIVTSAGSQRVTVENPSYGDLPRTEEERANRITHCRGIEFLAGGGGSDDDDDDGSLEDEFGGPAGMFGADLGVGQESIVDLILREAVGVIVNPVIEGVRVPQDMMVYSSTVPESTDLETESVGMSDLLVRHADRR